VRSGRQPDPFGSTEVPPLNSEGGRASDPKRRLRGVSPGPAHSGEAEDERYGRTSACDEQCSTHKAIIAERRPLETSINPDGW